MKEADDIIYTSHRPWPLPIGNWSYFQEWNNALFLHWKISPKELTEFIPAGLILDTFNGDAWISVVAFTMQNIRPNGLLSVSGISNFHEINIRTYVKRDNKQGVYFLKIEAGKSISVFIARVLSGLPYVKSTINRSLNKGTHSYISADKNKSPHFKTSFKIVEEIESKTDLDKWLIERYCLYLSSYGKLYRYEIHHREWPLEKVVIKDLKVKYEIGKVALGKEPTLSHFSTGVKVISWKRKYLDRI